jgi:tRNA pseudouridine55 synthase
MNGVLVVDKPGGRTSHDVVALARRALGVSRIGHTGTLDPFATGVLPLVIGRATRLARFLSAADKTYMADVRLGAASPTYDSEGLPEPFEAPRDPGIGRDAVERELGHFRGTYQQTPPPFSAKKVGGVRAYKRARANQPVELRPVSVTVSSLDLEACEGGRAVVRIVCSTGFYVRAFAHELGQRLGCGAHLEALRRTRAADFDLDTAISVETLVEEGPAARRRLISMDDLLPRLPPVVLTEVAARRAAHGGSLSPGDFSAAEGADLRQVRLMDVHGHLVGIGEGRPGGLLHPAIVLV